MRIPIAVSDSEYELKVQPTMALKVAVNEVITVEERREVSVMNS